MNLTFCAPCIFGLEGICANELKFLGLKNVRAENGRVLFEGDFYDLAKANICSRYAERIQILLAEFRARTFDELFEGVRAVEWERFIGMSDAFPVKGSCLSSALMSVPDCQKIVKKAVVSRLSDRYMLSWFEETGAVHQIQFLIIKDKVSVLLDTSGAGLHKRGYRAESNEAPIKETLAAAMAELARVRPNHFVTDPMCGSGTIVIEAAMKAKNLAPGLNRCHFVTDPMCGSGTIVIEAAMKAKNIAPGLNRYFAAERWSCVPADAFEQAREEAGAAVRQDISFRAEGYDIDDAALETAARNAEIAGVADLIRFEHRDLRDFKPAEGYQTVITNPPYGERLLSIEEAESLYRVMGERFIREKGKSYTVISPDDDFEKLFGRRADKRRKVYNGTLKCQIYQYFL